MALYKKQQTGKMGAFRYKKNLTGRKLKGCYQRV